MRTGLSGTSSIENVLPKWFQPNEVTLVAILRQVVAAMLEPDVAGEQ